MARAIGSYTTWDKEPGELNDLSAHYPKLHIEMTEIWNRYSQETGVILPSPPIFRMEQGASCC